MNIVKTGLTRSKNCKKAIATYYNYRVFGDLDSLIEELVNVKSNEKDSVIFYVLVDFS